MTVKKPAMKRVGDYDKTFGPNLDEIDGTQVVLHDYSIGVRSLTRDGVTEDRAFCTVEVSETEDGPTKTFHAWSDSINEKLGAIPKDQLPLMATFRRVTTGSGRSVWDVS